MRPQYFFWGMIAALAAIDYAWAWAAGIKININYDFGVAWFCISFGIFLIYTKIKPRPRIACFALAVAQFSALVCVTSVLMYLAAALDFPLIDQQLASVDRHLGFDWLAIFNWVKAHPVLDRVLDLAYWSLPPQIVVIPIILSVTGRFERMREFILLFATTLLLVIALSAFLPAAGAWDFYGVADLTSAYYIRDFHAIRSGSMTELDLTKLTGIIQFPSFHAALGLMLIMATRGIYLVFPLSTVCNVLMIVSATTHGGHHLADVLAGLAVVPLAWRMLMMDRVAQNLDLGPSRKFTAS